jgi:hypothetical protein
MCKKKQKWAFEERCLMGKSMNLGGEMTDKGKFEER